MVEETTVEETLDRLAAGWLIVMAIIGRPASLVETPAAGAP
jgi:hypothetical protein